MYMVLGQSVYSLCIPLDKCACLTSQLPSLLPTYPPTYPRYPSTQPTHQATLDHPPMATSTSKKPTNSHIPPTKDATYHAYFLLVSDLIKWDQLDQDDIFANQLTAFCDLESLHS